MSNTHTSDKPDNTLANLEARLSKLENGIQKQMGSIRKKMADERALFSTKIGKKLDQDAAMTDKEHEEFIAEIAEMATRAHLRKVLKNKVEAIVNSIIEDLVTDVVEHVIEDVIKDIVEDVEDVINDAAGEKLATVCHAQQQQALQVAAILNWIRGI